MPDTRAKQALEYLDGLIVDQQKKLLSGAATSPDPRQTAINYQAGVLLNGSMTRLRKEIAAIFSKEEPDDGE